MRRSQYGTIYIYIYIYRKFGALHNVLNTKSTSDGSWFIILVISELLLNIHIRLPIIFRIASLALALCKGNPAVTSGFLSERASNEGSVSMTWSRHAISKETRGGVTKPISSVAVFSKFFSIFKTHVRYWTKRCCLTSVAAAQMRSHLSNKNVIQRI